MANPEHVAILKQGVDVWNAWRRNPDTRWPDLRRADLAGANLRRANLNITLLDGVDLRGADLTLVNLVHSQLRQADLRKVQLISADLSTADLSEANLEGAFLAGVNLRHATMRKANCSEALFFSPKTRDIDDPGATAVFDILGADLSWADLDGAILTNAKISGVVFGSNDLGNAIGLETIMHSGPSIVDVNTVLQSGDKLPVAFLRGAGLPDQFIT
jgi:uncharacterized protein YjbI with pentapeptide repeats